MAQVSYGTITITDTTDLTTYIRYATKAPLTAASQFQETPTTDTRYIAVLSIPTSDSIPAWNSTDWKWSEFIGTDGVSVLGTREIYYLKTNSAAVTAPVNGSDISQASANVENQWTKSVPTYVINGEYWTCIQTHLDGSPIWVYGSPVLNQSLTDMNHDIDVIKSVTQQSAEDSQGALGIARAMQQNFWWWGTDQVVDSSFTLPAGAYTSDVKVDDFRANPTGGYLVTRSDGVYLNNGQYVLMGLTGNALKFYRPGTTKLLSGTETVDAQLTSNGLQITNGSITLGSNFAVNSSGSLTAKSGTIGGITIGTSYLTTNQSRTTYDATASGITLTTNGFGAGNGSANTFYVQASTGKLYATNADIKGVIKADTGYIGGTSGWTIAAQQIYSTNRAIGTDDSMFLATKNLAGTVAGKELTTTSPSWRFTVGSKFGVDNTGKLYASGAEISGKIIVSENSGSNVYTTDEVDDNFATQESIPTSVNELEDIDTYATKQEVSNVDNFVKSHIEIDGSTMSLVADSTDVLSKLVMSVNGLSLCGTDGKSLAEYGEDAIIGKRDSFHIRIVTSNSDPDLNGIFFYQGENPVAYINGNRLYISQSVVLQQMDVGTPMNNGTGGQWSWKVHPVDNKNNLYLKWLG